MKTVSVCMIVKNEEPVLERCLKSAALFADELIVVDTGSDDGTKAIARRYTDKVYDFLWTDDFAAARNASYEKATCDYIMWLDADHVVEQEDIQKINRLKETLTDEQSIFMQYESPENQMTLLFHMMMKRDTQRSWQGVIHERYPIRKPCRTTEITIHHRQTHRSNFIWHKALIQRLSREEIKAHFWLAMQCAMDLILAGDARLARDYLEIGLSAEPTLEEMCFPCLVTGNVLMWNQTWREAMDAYDLLISAYCKGNFEDTFRQAVVSACLKAEKCAVKIGNIPLAEQYNEQALNLDAQCVQALVNRLWFARLRPATISVCMIVKNEEPVLERCLKCAVQFADELIIVDTGSDDGTKEIAHRYTDKVYDHKWTDDFAAARNASFEKASCDYIMWLDADDIIEAEDIERIKQLKGRMPNVDVVYTVYRNDRDENDFGYDWNLLRDRIIRRSLQPRWKYDVHEVLSIQPEWKGLDRPDIQIIHRKERVNEPGRNLRILHKMRAEGKTLNSFLRGYLCREYSEHGEDEKAVQVYNELLAEGVSASTLHYAGIFYINSMKRLKRHRELLEQLVVMTQQIGEDAILLCAMGDACLRLGAYHKAIAHYRKAMVQSESLENKRAYFSMCHAFIPLIRMAKAYSKLDDTENALRCFHQAESIDPNNLEVLVNKLFYETKCKKGAMKNG